MREIDHNFYMNLAVEEAWKWQLLTYPNPAVGGVLLDKNGKIVSISAHQKSGEPHSEVLLLKDGYIKLSGDREIEQLQKSEDIHQYLYINSGELFFGATLYTTLEPCNHFGKTPPCSLLIKNLGIYKVIIGFEDNSVKAGGGANFLNDHGVETIFLNSQKARDLLEPFLKWSSGRFIFFKYAQTLNGNIWDGIISSKESRTFVHQLRDKIDLLLIGGNTVREDRPTLDSRLVGGDSPDILIYSKEKEFDKTIPLFSVPNREVFIESSLQRLEEYRYIMVEGGYSLLKVLSKEIDWLLLFISPKLVSSEKIDFERENFEILHQQKIDKDLMIWMRRKRN
jgi:diaminohydroxyphosphoribosylaminopyrimidine deaminase/5-amino-6-(5-phosphoribosylamino)uracil reductase